jgi:hypothetical protein
VRRVLVSFLTVALGVAVLAVAPADAQYLSLGVRPRIVQATGGDAEVALRWTDAGVADAYWIYRDGDLQDIVGDDEDLTDTWTDDDVENGTTPVYVVGAQRAGGNLSASTPYAATPAPPHGYTDVGVGNEVVRWVTEGDGTRPVLGGFAGNRFRPTSTMTRGEVVGMLYAWVGRPAVSGLPALRYVDVPVRLRPAVRWATSDPDGRGPRRPVVTGIPGRRFQPGHGLTRGAAVAMFHRLVGSPTGNPGSRLRDVPASLRPAVNWAVAYGIFGTYPDRTFRPNRPTTRLGGAASLRALELTFAEIFALLAPEEAPGTDWQPPVPLPEDENSAYLDRPPWTGAGWRSSLDTANSLVGEPEVVGDEVHVDISSDVHTQLWLELPAGQDRLEPGLYADEHFAADPDFWSGPDPDHVGDINFGACPGGPSWYAVDGVEYRGDGTISALDLRFGSACPGSGPETTYVGAVRFDADHPVTLDTPRPVPGDLWQAPASGVPASGNYAYFTSEPGDWIGQGTTQLYTGSDGPISFSTAYGSHTLHVRGFPDGHPYEIDGWEIDLPVAAAAGRLREGFYPDLLRVPFHNRGRGGLSVKHGSHGCSNSIAWAAIDDVEYDGDEITRLDLRFEHRCAEFGTPEPPSRGEIHYVADDAPPPLSPGPIPDDFWAPADGVTPDDGTFLYLESMPGDDVGGGGTWLYEAPTASFSRYARTFSIGQQGRPSWDVEVRPPEYDGPLSVGYYDRAMGWGSPSGWFHATGNGHGCNNAISWFVVDEVAYDDEGALTLLHVRFEQECYPGDPPLRGVLRWEAAT